MLILRPLYHLRDQKERKCIIDETMPARPGDLRQMSLIDICLWLAIIVKSGYFTVFENPHGGIVEDNDNGG